MRTYARILANVLKESTAYRVNHVVSILVIVLPLAFIFLLWEAIYGPKGTIAGYTREMMVTYYVLLVLIQDLTSAGVNYEIASDIRGGQLSGFLMKPMSYPWYSLLIRAGVNIPYSFLTAILLFAYVGIIHRAVFVQTSPFHVVVSLVSLALAFGLGFVLTFALSITAFWMEENEALQLVFDTVATVASGAILPLALFPQTLRTVFDFLPFKYLLNFPVEVYLGRLGVAECLLGLGWQVAWILVLGTCAYVLWRAGLKAYRAYGG